MPLFQRPINGFLIAITAAFGMSSFAFAQHVKVVPPEGANWRENAEHYLQNLKGEPFNARRDTTFLRCVKMNNYPCLKQRTAGWPHTPGPEGQDGAHDGADGHNGHAIFEHPKWSIVADLRWFERRTDGGRTPKSALELAEIYMPWCDTLGSAATKADRSGKLWGKSCNERISAPAGFKGPMCQKPATGQASAAQRQACNDPPSAARTWTSGAGVTIDQKLELFDGSGRPTPLMMKMIGRVVTNENGHYKPNDLLLQEAAAAFVPISR